MSKAQELLEILKKCGQADKKPGRPWCIYSHTGKKKGWPKHYKTKADAQKALKMMHVFGG